MNVFGEQSDFPLPKWYGHDINSADRSRKPNHFDCTDGTPAVWCVWLLVRYSKRGANVTFQIFLSVSCVLTTWRLNYHKLKTFFQKDLERRCWFVCKQNSRRMLLMRMHKHVNNAHIWSYINIHAQPDFATGFSLVCQRTKVVMYLHLNIYLTWVINKIPHSFSLDTIFTKLVNFLWYLKIHLFCKNGIWRECV